MENPTFHLAGIVKAKDSLEDFEGPLALILLLLSKNKIEIKDIQISQILDQYLAYLDEMKQMDLEIASDFVAMASHLAYIKTKVLLAGEEEEVSELEQLIQSLEALQSRDHYARIKAVVDQFQALYQIGSQYGVKPPEPLPSQTGYAYDHAPETLCAALQAVCKREEARLPQPIRQGGIPQPILYSVTKKTVQLIGRLRSKGPATIGELIRTCSSRSEVVATFIAILELCRVGTIHVDGEDQDFSISYTGTEAPNSAVNQ